MLKITDWCDAGCAWCHEGSTRRGRHGDIDAICALLSPLPAGVEIAIGGGDPLSHPGLETLVSRLSEQGLICSVTINGRHLDRHRDQLARFTSTGHLYGVGVSLHRTLPEWDYPHMVTHAIAGIDDPEQLLDAPGRRKLLILGYKSWGRGMGYREAFPESVRNNLARWYRLLPLLAMRHHLSFDTLAISQLAPRRLFRDPALFESRFMGEEGQFSLYVDGVEQSYAISSYAPERKPWHEICAMFRDVRGRARAA